MPTHAGQFIRRHPLLKRLLAVPRAARRAVLRSRESLAQEVLDRLSTLAKEDVVVQVEEFGGVFACSAQSDLLRRIIRFGYYEPVLSRLFFESIRADLDIIDVGANIGFYAVGGAHKLNNARVLAAEPTLEAFTRLRANVERNGLAERIILFNGLISSDTGQQTIRTIAGREEYSSVGPMTHPSIKNADVRIETVQSARLDDLVRLHALRPGLLKVDVEGAEASVFAGASEVLSKFRPIVIAEISNHLLRPNGVDGRDIVRMFERLDYHVVDPNDPRAEPGTADFGDIFCTPRKA